MGEDITCFKCSFYRGSPNYEPNEYGDMRFLCSHCRDDEDMTAEIQEIKRNA